MEFSDTYALDLVTGNGKIHVRQLASSLSKEEVREQIVLLLENIFDRKPLRVLHLFSGKPYIEGMEHIHLSISHSEEWIAVYWSEQTPVGIDIEQEREKIRNIEKYFINAEEKLHFGDLSLDKLHLIWGAKEAIFKFYEGKFTALENEVTIEEIDQDAATISAQTPHGKIQCNWMKIQEKIYLVWTC